MILEYFSTCQNNGAGGKCSKPYGDFLYKNYEEVRISCIFDPKCAAFEYSDSGYGRLCLSDDAIGGQALCHCKSFEITKEL